MKVSSVFEWSLERQQEFVKVEYQEGMFTTLTSTMFKIYQEL